MEEDAGVDFSQSAGPEDKRNKCTLQLFVLTWHMKLLSHPRSLNGKVIILPTDVELSISCKHILNLALKQSGKSGKDVCSRGQSEPSSPCCFIVLTKSSDSILRIDGFAAAADG